jgi:hypothetical protein
LEDEVKIYTCNRIWYRTLLKSGATWGEGGLMVRKPVKNDELNVA